MSGAGVTRGASERCSQALAALEDHPDLVGTAEEVAGLLAAASAIGDPCLVARARRLDAELVGRRGELGRATADLWRVHEHAAAHGHAQLLAQTHHNLSWIHRDIGDLTSYLDHAVQAVEQLDAQAPPGVRAMHLLRLADALDDCGSPVEALERYTEAEEYAVAHGETFRQVRCLNNRAYCEYLMGDVAAARATVDRLVQVSAAHGMDLDAHQLDTIARIEIALGRYDQAATTSTRAREMFLASEDPLQLASLEPLVTRAVAERLGGHLDAAQRTLDDCRARAAEVGAASLLTMVEGEQAQLHAARGDWEAAYHGAMAFRAAEKALLSEQRAAQSTLRLAVLRTREVQAEADRFRDEALHDTLTGLWNRRWVDQHLPELLAGTPPRGPLAAAFLDLDHFKRVNDTCSHAVGDQVLVAVATLLEEFVTRWRTSRPGREGFAARMGGEEFLLVLRSGSQPGTVRDLERLRRRVAGQDWAAVTGTVPVTASIGLSWARSDDTQAALLGRADALLYAAKRAGRDRLVHDAALPVR